jgi:SAM-dependent methyltransferase
MLTKLKRWLIRPPDPVLLVGQRERVNEIVASLGKGAVIVDVGARARRWPGVLALDYWGENIDVRGDAMRLPFADESLNGVISTYVLEHIPCPEQAMAEMHRVLKPEGILYVETPFMFGFHGHTSTYSDYTRWTFKGLEQLCQPFRSVETGTVGGPASAMAYVLREGIPILLSFTDSRFYWGMRALMGWLVFPLKYLDWKTLRHPKCVNVAAGLYCKAIK